MPQRNNWRAVESVYNSLRLDVGVRRTNAERILDYAATKPTATEYITELQRYIRALQEYLHEVESRYTKFCVDNKENINEQ